jgi:predicted RNA binding protein YcfA (HicA-like mRNA interferase family)
MPRFPALSGKEMLRFCESLGFVVVRVRGSHHRLRHADGRVTTVAVHGNTPLPVGTMHKIVHADIGLDNDSFRQQVEEFRKR